MGEKIQSGPGFGNWGFCDHEMGRTEFEPRFSSFNAIFDDFSQWSESEQTFQNSVYHYNLIRTGLSHDVELQLGCAIKEERSLVLLHEDISRFALFFFCSIFEKNYILDESNQGLYTKRETVTIKPPQRKKKF